MPAETIGDLSISYPATNSLLPNQGVLVTKFLNTLVIPKYQYERSPFDDTIESEVVAGEKISIPRDEGDNNPREVDVNGDRSFNPSGTRITRREGTYSVNDLDFGVGEDADVQYQVNRLQSFTRRIKGAQARHSVITLIKALNAVPVTGDKEDRVAGTVGAKLKWDTTNKVRVETGDDVGWNKQKLVAARTLMQKGSIPLTPDMTCAITTPGALEGFSQDEQTTNQDYAHAMDMMEKVGGSALHSWYFMPNYGGLSWASIPDFPTTDAGDTQGLPMTDVATNPTNHVNETDFIFAKDNVRFLISPENGKYKMKIYFDDNSKQLRARWSAYLGAMVMNPTGIIRVTNLNGAQAS